MLIKKANCFGFSRILGDITCQMQFEHGENTSLKTYPDFLKTRGKDVKGVFTLSKKNEAHEYTIKGISISCPICKHDKFWEGKAQLNTAAATFFDFDWLNKQVLTLSCDQCSHILWFDQER
ncbi:hypothetical protein LSG31_19480 [Fodinisporobacter ferrooxydans]|uniref:DNA-binding protein n=1 Tax=Fodinisporobacter ferrooxydans TaxID=2901836 RepID=A0ABY4CKQ8_9BACL|nr:hypothetical protein LSG31_19480 [Alicyclobacillaceae bacterium MYW30-H2]